MSATLTFVHRALNTPSLSFFDHIDRVLRRGLGVSETAKPEVTVKPAPEEAEKPKAEEKPKSKKLPDLDAPEFLNDMPNIIEGDEPPFDPTKAIDINIDDHTEGKVGLVPGEEELEAMGKAKVGGADWDKDSAESLERLLKEHGHDEL